MSSSHIWTWILSERGVNNLLHQELLHSCLGWWNLAMASWGRINTALRGKGTSPSLKDKLITSRTHSHVTPFQAALVSQEGHDSAHSHKDSIDFLKSNRFKPLPDNRARPHPMHFHRTYTNASIQLRVNPIDWQILSKFLSTILKVNSRAPFTQQSLGCPKSGSWLVTSRWNMGEVWTPLPLSPPDMPKYSYPCSVDLLLADLK